VRGAEGAVEPAPRRTQTAPQWPTSGPAA
jgi:hypothetical protein